VLVAAHPASNSAPSRIPLAFTLDLHRVFKEP
jgi:hypothetical protein